MTLPPEDPLPPELPPDDQPPGNLPPVGEVGGLPPGGVPDYPPADGPVRPVRRPADPVAVLAIGCGLVGIVTFGLLLALVTGVLAASAGQRARAAGRSLDNAYIALALAVLDGVVWLVLHFAFALNFAAG